MSLSYLQNHYDLVEIDNGYQFTTSEGVAYFLTFIYYPVLSDFLSINLYMFNIERGNLPPSDKRGQNDVKVRNTVLYFWDLFFQHHEDALITICDISDGKQYARKRLFDKWFKEFNHNRLCRIDADCMIEENKTFVSLFYAVNHAEEKRLQQTFAQLMRANFYN